MARSHRHRTLVTFLGAVFYIVAAVQWLWSSLPYLPGIINFVNTLQSPAVPHEPLRQTVTNGLPSGIAVVVTIMITFVAIAITLYIFMKLPSVVSKTGEKLTRNVSSHIVPVVSHHAALTPKKTQVINRTRRR